MLGVLGVLLLGLAVVAGRIGGPAFVLWRALRHREPTTPARWAAPGSGPRVPALVLMTGTARPAATGALLSTVHHQPAVWHRHTVHHRQTHYRTDAQGRTRRRTSRKRLGGSASPEPFRLETTDGVVEIRPAEMRVDRARRLATRILPALATQGFSDDLPFGGTTQHAYHHREWILTAGTPLSVLGEAVGSGRTVVLRRPGRGPHVISTRTVPQLRRRSFVLALVGIGVAVAAGVTGIVLLVVAVT